MSRGAVVGASQEDGNGRLLHEANSGDNTITRVGPDDPAALAIRATLASAVQRFDEAAPAAKRGEVEGVHQLRSAARRIRSILRAFHDLCDAGWCEPLDAELKCLAQRLGAVRDLDVLQARLHESAGAATVALGPLFTRLQERHVEASRALNEALQSERYQVLLAGVNEAAQCPALVDRAEKPCREVLPPLVVEQWLALRAGARGLGPSSPNGDFHSVRKQAKRTRYVAESIGPFLGSKPASAIKRLARRSRRVQDVLGEHQDAVVACAEIVQAANDRHEDGSFNFACGRLMERQDRAAQDARQEFFQVWHKIERKKNLRWLKVHAIATP
jgi:CHAD domain-containing protein